MLMETAVLRYKIRDGTYMTEQITLHIYHRNYSKISVNISQARTASVAFNIWHVSTITRVT